MSAFVPFESDDEIVAIGRGLVARTLPKAQWTHAAHFASALWLMECRPEGCGGVGRVGDLASHPKAQRTRFRMGHLLPEADETHTLPGLIRAYNEATGVANTDSSGYHETITRASLRVARTFREERAELPLFMVCNELMASPLGRSDWVLRHWSREVLFSVEARRGWVAPDLLGL